VQSSRGTTTPFHAPVPPALVPSLELVTLTEEASYVNAPTGIGVVRNGKRAALVDSGLDENLARKLLNHLKEEGVTVEAVVNSHGHADHCGGNAFTVKRAAGAEVWAPDVEADFIRHPTLEPLTLFGAKPPAALAAKWLQAAPSPVHHVVDVPRHSRPAEREIIGLKWRFHPVPGHSPNQVAVETAGAVFLADALLPARTLEKHGVPFAVDPAAQRESARTIPRIGSRVYQTYHGGAVADLKGLVAANVRAVDAMRERVIAALDAGPVSSEDVFQRVAADAKWDLSVQQFALNFATVNAHLAVLEREGRVGLRVEDERLEWVAQ
jgi:glyoxylase-like metal-dependent hydrolase (beta-lactamase superfamily II)